SMRNKHETPPETKFKSAGERNLQVLNVERFFRLEKPKGKGNACWPAFDTNPTRKRWTNEPRVGLYTQINL
ncbi:hypothetical protein KR018_002078, partial [Drosophila ironensis]